jgi:hypothetical protein
MDDATIRMENPPISGFLAGEQTPFSSTTGQFMFAGRSGFPLR